MPEREVYVPLPIPADPARDARVAARRAADARKAGRALDRLLSAQRIMLEETYGNGWRDGYRASEEHHSGHYGVPDDLAVHVPHRHLDQRDSCSDPRCHAGGGLPCTYCGGQICRLP